jgi:hypothetical protein
VLQQQEFGKHNDSRLAAVEPRGIAAGRWKTAFSVLASREKLEETVLDL